MNEKLHTAPVAAGARPWRLPFLLLSCVMALSLLLGACDFPGAGTPAQQSGQDALCNVSLFTGLRFSSSQRDGQMLYAAYDTDSSFSQQVVVALNPATEKPIWQHAISASANGATRLIAADGVVYALFERVNTDGSSLFALDAQTGQQLWTYAEDGADDIAACHGVLALVGYRSLHVFAGKTGKLLWSYSNLAENELLASPLGGTLSITADTLYVIGVIYAPGTSQAAATVHALSLQDGKERWHVQFSSGKDATGGVSLTLTGQALYALQSALDAPGHLVALRPQDGKQLWSATSAEFQKILMAANDTLYLANDWQIDALSSSTGAHLWSQRFGQTANSVVGSAQHGIYETELADNFCSLDLANGKPRWCLRLALLGWDGTPYFVDANTIYLFSEGDHTHPDDNHALYVVDKQTGKVRKHFQIHSLAGAITTL